MTIIREKLKDRLKSLITRSKKISIGVGLATIESIKWILDEIPEQCELEFVIGVDLPTHVSVFELLFEREKVSTRIPLCNKYFHPKVYIFELIDSQISVFIGSGNFTTGGLEENCELFVEVSDMENTSETIAWFRDVFQSSTILDKEFISKYTLITNNDEHLDRSFTTDNMQLKRSKLNLWTRIKEMKLLYFLIQNLRDYSSRKNTF